MMWKMVEGDEVSDEVDNGGLVNGFRCCLKLKKNVFSFLFYVLICMCFIVIDLIISITRKLI